MDDIDLIKKLIRRHRRELTECIGAFRVKTVKGPWDAPEGVELHALSSRRVYKATVARGAPDWLNINDLTGRAIATLD
jgi:hypothetical protein